MTMTNSTTSGPRSSQFVATATTLIALVAMVAGAPEARGHTHARATQVELVELVAGRAESAAVRAVAAVMAAAARDILTGGPCSADLLAPAPLDLGAEEWSRPRLEREETGPPRAPALAERLLDLPPPVC